MQSPIVLTPLTMLIRPSHNGVSSVRELFGQDGRPTRGACGPAAFVVEHQDVTARNGRACAMRMEAAGLRRDIKEARDHIDRLQRRYLSGDGSMTRYSQLPSSSAGTGRW